jgi:hypothetical protein
MVKARGFHYKPIFFAVDFNTKIHLCVRDHFWLFFWLEVELRLLPGIRAPIHCQGFCHCLHHCQSEKGGRSGHATILPLEGRDSSVLSLDLPYSLSVLPYHVPQDLSFSRPKTHPLPSLPSCLGMIETQNNHCLVLMQIIYLGVRIGAWNCPMAGGGELF